MSRVRGNCKYVNTPKGDSRMNCGPVRRYFLEGAKPYKGMSLTAWLQLRYNISYKTYRNKSATRRKELYTQYREETHQYPIALIEYRDGVFYSYASDKILKYTLLNDKEDFLPPWSGFTKKMKMDLIYAMFLILI